ncbi:lysophospholipase [Akkermansiaceae bacterium]|nr:lysophospholipase [Akkermansiaceae bacterium]
MRIEVSQVHIQNQTLHRLTLNPEITVRGGLIFFHGQGDFIDRYPSILKGFVDAGYRCILTDMPGHGRSKGKRGVIPSLGFADELLQDSLSLLEDEIVIAGHSMGGLMAMRFLFQNVNLFEAAWISSPLLDPMLQANRWMKIALPLAAQISPSTTVSTGVSNSDCGDKIDRAETDEDQALFHDRISIGWARELRDAAQEVREELAKMAFKKPILFTQGDSDSVCPIQILEDRLKKLPSNQISFKKIKEALHEPFCGSTRGQFLTHLNHWIAHELG